MNQVRQAVARLAAKLVPSSKTPAVTAVAKEIRPVDAEQLRQIVGGSAPELPKGNW